MQYCEQCTLCHCHIRQSWPLIGWWLSMLASDWSMWPPPSPLSHLSPASLQLLLLSSDYCDSELGGLTSVWLWADSSLSLGRCLCLEMSELVKFSPHCFQAINCNSNKSQLKQSAPCLKIRNFQDRHLSARNVFPLDNSQANISRKSCIGCDLSYCCRIKIMAPSEYFVSNWSPSTRLYFHAASPFCHHKTVYLDVSSVYAGIMSQGETDSQHTLKRENKTKLLSEEKSRVPCSTPG